jgi:hypothetical protein
MAKVAAKRARDRKPKQSIRSRTAESEVAAKILMRRA